MECRVSAFSRVGGRERNEDACAYIEKDGLICCALADGAGGHRGGDVASRICIQTVLEEFERAPEVSTIALGTLLHQANEAVLREQQRDPAVGDMRSTLVVLVFDPLSQAAVWGHIGDSRLYYFRNGALAARTRDHSLVQTMIDGGLLTEEEAQTHAERNVLVASIGSVEAFQPSVLGTPCKLNDGDAFLLCSDGVWGLLEDIAFEQSLGRAASSEEWLVYLEELIAPRVQRGSDNYTALGVWCGEVPDNMRTIPAPLA